jgi:hypothetical protein
MTHQSTRILSIDIGISDSAPCTFAVMAYTDRYHYIRSGSLDPANLELFAALLQTERYDIVAIERGFLIPGGRAGADVLHNIEYSAMLYATALNEQRARGLGYSLHWLSQPQWSRYLCGTRRSANSREIAYVVKHSVLDLPPRSNGHLRDAIGLGIAAHLLSKPLGKMK